MDADRVTHAFLNIRAARAELAKEFATADGALKAKQEKLESVMLGFLNDHNVDSAPSAHGVFFKQLDVIPQANDWEKFYEWIVETNGFDFLERRVKKTAIKDYMSTNRGALPPGVTVFSKYVVRVRRSSKDGGAAEGDE